MKHKNLFLFSVVLLLTFGIGTFIYTLISSAPPVPRTMQSISMKPN
ncbi:MAG: hypothetical protein ACREBS_04865 [Nitrososphaerales archaeon]